MSIIWSNPVNRLHPLNRGLVSWWLNTPHARGGLTFRDLAGHNNGTLTNMDPTTDWVVGGRRGSWGALDFDGTNDYVDLGNATATSDLKPPLPVTVSCWLKPAVIDSYDVIYASDKFAVNYYGFLMQISTTGELVINFGDSGFAGGGARRSKLGNNPMTVGVWYHAVAVIKGATDMDLYVDAVDVAGSYSGSGGAMVYETTSSRIGETSGAQQFNGQLDDIRIYNRALNATEVRQLYNMSRTGYGDLLNRRRRVFKAPAAAGGGNAMPMAMHHYRQRRVG